MQARYLRLILLAVAVLCFGIWYHFRQPRFVAGETAPDFLINLPDGRPLRLGDLRGRPALLQFWASWCGPCRLENRQLVPLYQKHHPQGFEIISIGLESEAASWQRARQQDNLIWPYHAMESAEFNGPLAAQFRVTQIPTTFLINADGKIMGVNLPPEEMDKLLSRQ